MSASSHACATISRALSAQHDRDEQELRVARAYLSSLGSSALTGSNMIQWEALDAGVAVDHLILRVA